MALHLRAVCAVVAVAVCVSVQAVSAQEQAPLAEDFLAQTAQDSVLEWLWGEAVAVDPLTKTITVKYLDYDTDTEREMAVVLDDATTFENAASIAGIAVGDTLSIDYMVTAAGTVTARNISVEKAMPLDTQIPALETAPAEMDMPVEAQAQSVPEVGMDTGMDFGAEVPVDEAQSVPDITTVPAE
jgi:hypothetical protein